MQFTLSCLLALVCGRRLNDDHTQETNSNKNQPLEHSNDDEHFSDRSYGFKDPDNGYVSQENDNNMPTASSKKVKKTMQEPKTDDFDEPENIEDMHDPEKMDSSERLVESEVPEEQEKDKDDFEQVKKVKEVSIFSLLPKEKNKALDPITEQQQALKMRVNRPGRDLSIIVRNRHHPVLIARHVPVHWIPNYPHKHHHPRPHKPAHPPNIPSMPKHKPCKPCDPKVHKKYPHKPKKPKKKHKKPKKEHCHPHHKPKKPHHKKLVYYAPMSAAMNYYYRNRVPSKMIAPIHNYDVVESPEDESENIENETEKPFHEQIEDDVEEHRLAEISGPFDEEEPAESHMKSFKKTLKTK